MTTTIYEKADKHFGAVSAYAISLKSRGLIGTIKFKFPRDGAGRVYCYVHIFGSPMVRGWADGYGYDKRSAACEAAIRSLGDMPQEMLEDVSHITIRDIRRIIKAVEKTDGDYFNDRIRRAGYQVWQIV